jgi:hypothetical protein
MLKKIVMSVAVIAGGITLGLTAPGHLNAAKAKPVKIVNDGRAKCYECHDEVKALKEGSKHAKLACTVCHDKLAAHMDDPEKNAVTIIDQALCGNAAKASMKVSIR